MIPSPLRSNNKCCIAIVFLQIYQLNKQCKDTLLNCDMQILRREDELFEKNNQEEEHEYKRNYIEFKYYFDWGIFIMRLKREHLRIKIIILQTDNQQENLEQLFPDKNKKEESKVIHIILTNDNLKPSLIKQFGKIDQLYEFIANHIHDKNVVVNHKEIKLIKFKKCESVELNEANKQGTGEIDNKQITENANKQIAEIEQSLVFADFVQPKSPQIQINLTNIQSRLLQFSDEQLDFLSEFSHLMDKTPNSVIKNQYLCSIKNILSNDDIYDLLDEILVNQEEEINLEEFNENIKAIQKEIQEFQKIFPSYKKVISKPDDTISIATSRPDSAIPSNYAPTQSVPTRPRIPVGLTPSEQLRFQANQTKKQKLKMAKQMLKMGFSTAQVIQRIQNQQRLVQLNKNPGSTFQPPTQPPVREVGQKLSPLTPPKPLIQTANEKAIRERLISLMKQKRYKKLQQIHQHMASEGLQTSIQNLKRILDELKAKSQQRRQMLQKQNKGGQSQN